MLVNLYDVFFLDVDIIVIWKKVFFDFMLCLMMLYMLLMIMLFENCEWEML